MASTMRFDTWENPTATKSVTMDQIAGGSGLVPIVPTSAAVQSGSASVGANGLVTFTGATSLTINNVFNSNYRNYRFAITLTGVSDASTNLDMRLTIGGADVTSNYNWAGYRSLAGSPSLTANEGNGAGYWKLAEISSGSQPSTSIGDIQDPYTSNYTFAHWSGHGFNGAYMSTLQASGRHFTGSSYDGVKIFPLLGNFTGTIQVYGYR